jgi:hypothetical protein
MDDPPVETLAGNSRRMAGYSDLTGARPVRIDSTVNPER